MGKVSGIACIAVAALFVTVIFVQATPRPDGTMALARHNHGGDESRPTVVTNHKRATGLDVFHWLLLTLLSAPLNQSVRRPPLHGF